MESCCKIRSRRLPCSALFQLLIPALALSAPGDEPPRDVVLVEKKRDELSNRDFAELAKKALAMQPDKWKHAETENFIVHYRRVTEAKKVLREVEFSLWFIANSLGATRERYQRKSHVFVFKDEAEWQRFIAGAGVPPWTHSFAHGDELFLNVRGDTGLFDSKTLAHEATHAVVARLYPDRHWPLWLNEGFAEYMSGASIAARMRLYTKGFQKPLHSAKLTLEELTAMTAYPEDEKEVAQLYQSSEKLVRFLMNELPKERFAKFVELLLERRKLPDAIAAVYGDEFKDFDSFRKKYDAFVK
jgi:hypothetical protein